MEIICIYYYYITEDMRWCNMWPFKRRHHLNVFALLNMCEGSLYATLFLQYPYSTLISAQEKPKRAKANTIKLNIRNLLPMAAKRYADQCCDIERFILIYIRHEMYR